MKGALIVLGLAVTVVPITAATGVIDHPPKVAAVEQDEKGLGPCLPVGINTDENGRAWMMLYCPESEATVILPAPVETTEAKGEH